LLHKLSGDDRANPRPVQHDMNGTGNSESADESILQGRPLIEIHSPQRPPLGSRSGWKNKLHNRGYDCQRNEKYHQSGIKPEIKCRSGDVMILIGSNWGNSLQQLSLVSHDVGWILHARFFFNHLPMTLQGFATTLHNTQIAIPRAPQTSLASLATLRALPLCRLGIMPNRQDLYNGE